MLINCRCYCQKKMSKVKITQPNLCSRRLRPIMTAQPGIFNFSLLVRRLLQTPQTSCIVQPAWLHSILHCARARALHLQASGAFFSAELAALRQKFLVRRPYMTASIKKVSDGLEYTGSLVSRFGNLNVVCIVQYLKLFYDNP